jgi:hypothetical protein
MCAYTTTYDMSPQMLAVQDEGTGTAVLSDRKESAAVSEDNKDAQPQQVHTTTYAIHLYK